MDRTINGRTAGVGARAQKVNPDSATHAAGVQESKTQSVDFTAAHVVRAALFEAAWWLAFAAGWQAAASLFGGGAA